MLRTNQTFEYWCAADDELIATVLELLDEQESEV